MRGRFAWPSHRWRAGAAAARCGGAACIQQGAGSPMPPVHDSGGPTILRNTSHVETICAPSNSTEAYCAIRGVTCKARSFGACSHHLSWCSMQLNAYKEQSELLDPLLEDITAALTSPLLPALQLPGFWHSEQLQRAGPLLWSLASTRQLQLAHALHRWLIEYVKEVPSEECGTDVNAHFCAPLQRLQDRGPLPAEPGCAAAARSAGSAGLRAAGQT